MKEKLPLVTKNTNSNEIETKNTKKRVRNSNPPKLSKKIKETPSVKNVDKARCEELKIKYLPIMKLYFNCVIDFEVFKTTLLKFKTSDKDIEFLLAFRWENFSQFEHDPAFQWFLDELENGIEEYVLYKCRTKAISLSTLLQTICYDEKLLSEVFKRPKLKEVITNNFAVELIPSLLERNSDLDILSFLNNYFPSIKDALKTELTMQKKGQSIKDLKFLDLLLFNCHFSKYILPLWDEGFRPYSQAEFNQRLFCLGNLRGFYFKNEKQMSSEKEIEELYNTITDNEVYNNFLVFPEAIDPSLLFITNHSINLLLFNRLQQKLGRNNANEELVKALVNNELTFIGGYYREKINMLDKLTDVLSQINFLNIPPSATFQAKIKKGTYDVLLGSYKTLVGSNIFDGRVSRIQPQASFAQEILFVVAMNLFSGSGDYSRSIKKLCDLLKGKGINSFESLKTLLYAYFLNVSNIENLKGYDKLFMELFVELEQKNEFKNLLEEYLNDFKYMCDNFDKLRNVSINESSLGEKIANKTFAFMEASFYPILRQYATLSESNYTFQLKKVHIQMADLLCMRISSRCVSLNEAHLLEKSIIDCFEECRVQSEKIGKRLFLDLTLIILIQRMVNLTQTPKVSLLKELLDRNIFEKNMLPKNNKEFALSVLLKMLIMKLDLKDQEQVQRNSELISYLFDQIDANGLTLGNNFLEAVAKMELNYQRKSRLSEKTQEFLKVIYNRCIHKVQGTEQQIKFEEMCTQELIKANTDPSTDPQAIHTEENHMYAERVYHEWFQGLGENSDQKLQQGFMQFKAYMDQEKEKELMHLASSMSHNMLLEYIRYGMGFSDAHKTAEAQLLIDKMSSYLQTISYFNKMKQISQQTPVQGQNQQQALREIENAKKLVNFICMIGYYSKEQSNQFIKEGSEALNILKLELFDQISHPSCNQGPFIRFIMALEPVTTNIKFPWIQRRNINFLTNCYINNNYQQLSADEKRQFISDIYEKLDERETLNEIESIPEHSFDFLGKCFIAENKERFGVITEKEIFELFNMERPFEYHSEIARDLKKYHTEMKTKKTDAVVSSFGFFARNTRNSNLPTDNVVDDEQLNEFNVQANIP